MSPSVFLLRLDGPSADTFCGSRLQNSTLEAFLSFQHIFHIPLPISSIKCWGTYLLSTYFPHPPANFLYKMVGHVPHIKPFFYREFLVFFWMLQPILPIYFFGPVHQHFIESIYVSRHSIAENWPHHSIENVCR